MSLFLSSHEFGAYYSYNRAAGYYQYTSQTNSGSFPVSPQYPPTVSYTLIQTSQPNNSNRGHVRTFESVRNARMQCISVLLHGRQLFFHSHNA